MAATVIDVRIEWENGVAFEVQAQEGSGPVVTIVKAGENGNLAVMWSALTDVTERYIKALMARIGKEMNG